MRLRAQAALMGDAAVLASIAVHPAFGADDGGVAADQHGLWPCPTFTSWFSLTATNVGTLSAPPPGGGGGGGPPPPPAVFGPPPFFLFFFFLPPPDRRAAPRRAGRGARLN